jgi:predicted acylesterase/phospholipase RssA/CRP-like cAMP-binding protein
MHGQARQAMARFVAGSSGPLETSSVEPPHIAWRELERFAAHWAELVPEDAADCATLGYELCRCHGALSSKLTQARAALRFDDPEVRRVLAQLAETEPFAAANGRLNGSLVPSPDDAMLDDLGAELDWIPLARGAPLFSEGDPSDSLYIVISGRLRVSVRVPNGEEKVVGEVARGETVGEMGLLASESRSATVTAIRDSELVRLSKAGFERVVEQHPRLMMGVTRLLVTRLQRSIHATRAPNTVSTIAIVSAVSPAVSGQVAVSLARALSELGSTLRVDRAAAERELGRPSAEELEWGAGRERIVGWLNDLETRYRFLVLEADQQAGDWTRSVVRQADRLLMVVDGAADSTPGPLERQLFENDSDQFMARRDLVIVHPSRSAQPSGTAALLATRQVSAHYHVTLDSDDQMRGLARRLVGKAVGLVLGSGGARGFAHVGVLRALREAQVPVDVIGGTSAGSLVGAWAAADWDDSAMVAACADLAGRAKRMLDYTVPVVAILSAGRFSTHLESMFGEQCIEDLWTTYYCASSNLSRAQLVIHDKGPLYQAVRASCSLPGVVPPVTIDGELHSDGVLLESLPVDAMSRISDGGSVIAVDVSAEVDLAHRYEFGHSLSGFGLVWNRVRPFRRNSVKAPNIMAVMARAAELSSVRTRLAQAQKVSLYINPGVSMYGLFDAAAYEEIIERGYQAACEALPGWLAAQKV